jgi:hypothetical protein
MIVFTFLPPYGQLQTLRGRVLGVDPTLYRIAPYIFVEGLGWYTKPDSANPTCAINSLDSTWTCTLRPEGSDTIATEFHVALVPAAVRPPYAFGAQFLPARLDTIAIARADTFRFGRSLAPPWNDWWIKKSVGRVGPDTNYFNERNAFVDSLDRLHLRMARRPDGRFDCAEVINKNSIGYGRYVWQIEGGIGRLDSNIVLGLFTWDNAAREYNSEIDIEFSRWGMRTDSNAQYVVQPHTDTSRIRKWIFPLTLDSSTHCFDWQPNSVSFKSARGFSNDCSGSLLFSWTYTGSNIPVPRNAKRRMNLWLVQTRAPRDTASVEIVIRRSVVTSVKVADGYAGVGPLGFRLDQNSPNPFNPETNIRFELPRSEYVELRVFDILGREVASLVGERLQAGRHEVKWTAANLGSGVYVCRLRAGVLDAARKLLLLR